METSSKNRFPGKTSFKVPLNLVYERPTKSLRKMYQQSKVSLVYQCCFGLHKITTDMERF